MTTLILDSEAFSRLARAQLGFAPKEVMAAMAAVAKSKEHTVTVPAAVLAEQYRGGSHDQLVDACLKRHRWITVQDTTREMARTIGHLLARAGRGSTDHVDATVVATAITTGGGVIATSDVDDLRALSADHPRVRIEQV